MACVTKRRGKWVVDWRDGAGNRRARFFETKRLAEDFLAKAIAESRQLVRPVVDPSATESNCEGFRDLAKWIYPSP